MIIKKYKRLILGISAIVLSLAVALTFYYFSLLPTLRNIVAAKVRAQANAAINNAVFYALTEKSDYNSLVTVYSDNSGKINMIQANSVKINTLARETSKFSQENINKIGDNGLDIPLGTLTGSEILTGQGPNVHFKTVPVGTVTADFYSEFTDAGINQTRHRIYIIVQAYVNVILPFVKELVEASTPVLVCESVLVGDVPDTFLKVSGESVYNLLPNGLT